ncbi:MAG: hypothetical protein HWD61_15355 [Parachlamydiaceae bacterium]|nr:MAG: hypothetical protein HWD61_15355 [Parachlamydiaceae bacterium]
MDVTIKNGRVIFAPFTPQEDRDPYSNKPGIRAYNKFIGIILKFFGKAEEVHVLGRENKPIYINKNSFKDWCERHKFDEKIAKTLTPEAIIRDIVYLAQLSKQIKANPNGQDYFDRAIFYLNHNNLKKGQKDLDSAISESPQNLEYLETRINLLLSKKNLATIQQKPYMLQ